MIYDILLLDIYAPLSSPMYVLSYFFFLTLLPALAIALAYERSDLKALNKWIHVVLFLSCLLVFVYFLQSGSELLMALSNQRLEIRDEGEEVARLSPITIGICGAALSLLSIGHMGISAHAKSNFLVTAASLLLGLGVLLLSGSRGPLLAFFVGASFLVLAIAQRKKRNSVRRRISRRIFFVVGAIFAAAIYTTRTSDIILLSVSRLLETSIGTQSNAHSEARLDIAADALNSFAESPFIGKSHLALNGTAYAHNAVLEALMATGILGSIFFFGSVLRFFVGAMNALRLKLEPLSYPLALVSIAMFTLSLFSMSISQSPEIWLMVVLMLTIAARSKISDGRQSGVDRRVASYG